MDVKVYVGLVLTPSGYCAVIPEFEEAISLGHSFVEAKTNCGDNLSQVYNGKAQIERHPIIAVKTATLNYLRKNGLSRDQFIDIIEVTINR